MKEADFRKTDVARSDVSSGALWSVIDGWVGQVLHLVVFTILARLLDPAAFGLVAIAILLNQFFETVVYSGITTPLIRGAAADRRMFDTGFALAVTAGALVLCILLLAADDIEQIYGARGLAHVINIISAVVLLNGLYAVQQAWFVRNLQFKPLALRSFTAVAGGGTVGVALAFFGFGVDALVFQYVTAAALSVVVLWLTCKWRPGPHISLSSLRQILRFGRHVSLTGFINFVSQNSDVLIVGYFLGAAAAGIYVIGKRIFITANALMALPLSKVSLPTFSRIQGDPRRLAQVFYASIGMTAVVTTPFFVGIAAVAPEFIPLLFGSQWEAAVPVAQALALIGIIQSMGLHNHNLMLAVGKPHWQTRLTLVYAIVNLAAFLLAVDFGVTAVAWAFVLRAYLLFPLSVWCVIRLIPVTPRGYLMAALPPLLASAVMVLSIALLRDSTTMLDATFRLFVLSASGAAVYCAVMLLIGRRSLGKLLSYLQSARTGRVRSARTG